MTELTPELIAEGLAREFVRRVQDLRKSADFDIADRIHISYTATSNLERAVEAYKEYIQIETLALSLRNEDQSSEPINVDDEFDCEKVTIRIVKA